MPVVDVPGSQSVLAPGISFDGPGRVRKTSPGFHEEFGALRARL
jgi:hypothetical protein